MTAPADAPAAAPRTPSLLRRLACLVYESLLVLAMLLVATLAFVLLVPDPRATALGRALLQAWLLLVVGGYFVLFWSKGGQTLAMKAWRIRVVTRDGAPLSPLLALRRFAWALPGVLAFGAGLLWALADRDRQFLHDRLAGTRLVQVDTA